MRPREHAYVLRGCRSWAWRKDDVAVAEISTPGTDWKESGTDGEEAKHR